MTTTTTTTTTTSIPSKSTTTPNTTNKCLCFNISYKAINIEKIIIEQKKYEEIKTNITIQWDIECIRYGQTMIRQNLRISQEKQQQQKRVPVRNYMNSVGIVEDNTLYPYHTSMYLLLDAYDSYDNNSNNNNDNNDSHTEQSSMMNNIEIRYFLKTCIQHDIHHYVVEERLSRILNLVRTNPYYNFNNIDGMLVDNDGQSLDDGIDHTHKHNHIYDLYYNSRCYMPSTNNSVLYSLLLLCDVPCNLYFWNKVEQQQQQQHLHLHTNNNLNPTIFTTLLKYFRNQYMDYNSSHDCCNDNDNDDDDDIFNDDIREPVLFCYNNALASTATKQFTKIMEYLENPEQIQQQQQQLEDENDIHAPSMEDVKVSSPTSISNNNNNNNVNTTKFDNDYNDDNSDDHDIGKNIDSEITDHVANLDKNCAAVIENNNNDDNDDDAWEETMSENDNDTTTTSIHNFFKNDIYGVHALPKNRIERCTILLKLLKHSLSEIQRDYKISCSIFIILLYNKDLDSVQILRQLLAIIDSEYVICEFPCTTTNYNNYNSINDHHDNDNDDDEYDDDDNSDDSFNSNIQGDDNDNNDDDNNNSSVNHTTQEQTNQDNNIDSNSNNNNNNIDSNDWNTDTSCCLNHICFDWKHLILDSLHMLLSCGITYITEDHSLCFIGFVRSAYLKEFGHLFKVSTGTTKTTTSSSCTTNKSTKNGTNTINSSSRNKSMHSSSTLKLKREIAANRGEATSIKNTASIPVDVIYILIKAIGHRACWEYNRLQHILNKKKKKRSKCQQQYQQQQNGDMDTENNNSNKDDSATAVDIIAQQCLDSYYNCCRTIIHISELTIEILPENERFYCIASECVLASYYAIRGTTVVQSYTTTTTTPTATTTSTKNDINNTEIEGSGISSKKNQRSILNELFPYPLESYGNENYLGLKERHSKERISCPLRLSNTIEYGTSRLCNNYMYKTTINNKESIGSDNSSNSTQQQQQPGVQSSLSSSLSSIWYDIDYMLHYKPPPVAFRNVVRALFVRDLVDIRISRLGYTDFLLWCGYNISLEDPLLYRYDYQYPVEEEDSDDSDSDSDDDDNDEEAWDIDENNDKLFPEQLHSRYGFTLSSLAFAWGEPWTEESHMSFQPGFRKAVTTVAMSCHRLNMPMELAQRIASFLHRDWWNDEYKTCWHPDCITHSIDKSIVTYHTAVNDGTTDTQLSAFLFNSDGMNLRECGKCHVTKYCSKRCQDDAYKATHVSRCCKLPCRKGKPTEKEHELYQTVFACKEMEGQVLPKFIRNNIPSSVSNNVDDDNDDENWEDDDDDDDSDNNNNNNINDDDDWESVDSNENDTPDTVTKVLHKFFSEL